MFVIVKVPADGTSAKSTDMKDILAPKPAGYVPHDMRVNGCERERLDAIDALNCAVRWSVEQKLENPFVKEVLNGLYGVNYLRGTENNGEPDPAGHNAISENVKDESRDIFVTVSTDHVSPQFMPEIAKLIAILTDTDRDIHVNVI